jgi:hypothetical protein
VFQKLTSTSRQRLCENEMEEPRASIESVKRTLENSPAIHRWGNSNSERISPRSGRLKSFESYSGNQLASEIFKQIK